MGMSDSSLFLIMICPLSPVPRTEYSDLATAIDEANGYDCFVYFPNTEKARLGFTVLGVHENFPARVTKGSGSCGKVNPVFLDIEPFFLDVPDKISRAKVHGRSVGDTCMNVNTYCHTFETGTNTALEPTSTAWGDD